MHNTSQCTRICSRVTVNAYNYTIPVILQGKTVQKKSSHMTLTVTQQGHINCTTFAKYKCSSAWFNKDNH